LPNHFPFCPENTHTRDSFKTNNPPSFFQLLKYCNLKIRRFENENKNRIFIFKFSN
jgi:hypothetical protein